LNKKNGQSCRKNNGDKYFDTKGVIAIYMFLDAGAEILGFRDPVV
jgi:hypothetical protein